jgi:hypothetical protein
MAQVPGAPVTIATTFSPYLSAPAAPEVTVQDAGGDDITVTALGGAVLLNVATKSEAQILTPVPPGVQFTQGVQSFTADLPTGASVATIRLHFDDVVPTTAKWYKLHDGGWSVWPDMTRVDDHTIELRITDGAVPGDDDGIENGFVTDPGALGVPIGNDPPSVTVPASVSVDAIGTNTVVVTYAASATDPEQGALSPVCDHPSGSTFAVGSTLVTCTAVDAGGLTGSASFTVTVVDVDRNDDGIRDTAPPTDKDQCKGNGWRSFNNPSFKNQGDCVSYVSTGGRNPGRG